MESAEIKNEILMSYQELVDYLLNKYGSAKYDYFCNESCRSKNSKISRSSEGLQCHHIDEDKAIQLSEPKYAIYNPYEYQKADRLVYCNILEHLLLHMKIAFSPRNPEANFWENPGVGGIFNILPGINDYYGGFEYKREYQKKLYEVIADNFDAYIGLLVCIKALAKSTRPDYVLTFSNENLSRGFEGNIVKRVYDRL